MQKTVPNHKHRPQALAPASLPPLSVPAPQPRPTADGGVPVLRPTLPDAHLSMRDPRALAVLHAEHDRAVATEPREPAMGPVWHRADADARVAAWVIAVPTAVVVGAGVWLGGTGLGYGTGAVCGTALAVGAVWCVYAWDLLHRAFRSQFAQE